MLEHILVARALIIPEAVVCTWRIDFCRTRFIYLGGYMKQMRESIVKVLSEDDHGDRVEIRRIHRKPIDATYL